MKRLLGAALVLSLSSAALAVPITYRGELASGVPASGSIPLPADGNGVDNPETWHWYAFYAQAGDSVTIIVDRTSAGIDPASSAFFGLPSDTDPMISLFDTPAGALLMGSGDDNDPPNVGGPFGDPNYTVSITDTGWHSVVVGNFLGLTDDPGNYDITVRGQTPEPATAGLMGLIGMVLARRFRR